MFNYNYFLKNIEEIRKDRNISYDDLLEDLISSRTYFRYLNNKENISLELLNYLVNKLKLTFSDLIFYNKHKITFDSPMNMFLYSLIKRDYVEANQAIDLVGNIVEKNYHYQKLNEI